MCSDAVSNLLRCVLRISLDLFRENEIKLRMSDARRSLESMVYDKEKFPLLIIITKDRGSYNITDICSGRSCFFANMCENSNNIRISNTWLFRIWHNDDFCERRSFR
ncbi:unnamed protein product [Heligmosomoides polygyrus]|uniref:Uncharacterized protein n=1 Tax=Heligmosomoides polygyrus TaxID=6339 RepID=A0A3P7TUV6_HELPZ|nr:unnamed protein product [Heligmosomoides polygyrus]